MTEKEAILFDFDKAHWLGLRKPALDPVEYKEFIRVQDRVREELKKQPELTHPLIHSPKNPCPGFWMQDRGTLVWYSKEHSFRPAALKVLHQGIAARFNSQLRRCDTQCSEYLDVKIYDQWLRSVAAVITDHMRAKN